MQRDTFNFTLDFEELIIAAFIQDPDKFYCRGQLLLPAYFSTSTSSMAMTVLNSYQERYSRLPTWEVFGQLLDDMAASSTGDVKPARDFISKLRSIPVNDIDYVVDRVVLFCRERAVLNAVKQAIKSLKEGAPPTEGYVRLFEDAVRIGENIDDIGYLLHADAERVIDKVMSPTFGVRTGIPQLDAIWKNGLAPGWLIVPLAPPKRYKTAVSLNVALSIVGGTVSEDVLYYACEISQEQAVMRALCNLSGLTEDFMFESTQAFKDTVQESLKNKVAANLIIKHFSIGTASIADLKSHARMVKKQLGVSPKLIVIDYADTIRASDLSLPQHIQQANVYKEAVAMGKEIGAAIWMPDRCTAATVGMKVPDAKSFQGAFAKGGIVDTAFGICATDTEYAQNILRFFFFINRHGAANQHLRGSIDPTTMRVNFGEPIPYEPEEQEEEQRGRGRGGHGGRGGRGNGADMPPELQE